MARSYQFRWCGLFTERSAFVDGKFLRVVRCTLCGNEKSIHRRGSSAIWKALWNWAGLHRLECPEMQKACPCGAELAGKLKYCQKCQLEKRRRDAEMDRTRKAELRKSGLCADCGLVACSSYRCKLCNDKHNLQYDKRTLDQRNRYRLRRRFRRWGLSEQEIRLCEELRLQTLTKKRLIWAVRKDLHGKV